MSESLKYLPVARRWQQQRHPMPSILALIERDSANETRYLLIKRINEPYAGKWGLVGGKWDFGESLQEAIIREVKEETGLTTAFVALRGLLNERMIPHGEADQGAHFLTFVCEVHASTGEPCEQAEGALSWFSASQLRELNATQKMIPTDYLILAQRHQTESKLPYVEAEVIAGAHGSQVNSVIRYETIV